MAAMVIDYLQQAFSKDNIAISYVYCRHNEQHKARDLVAALLRQLVCQLSKLPEAVEECYTFYSQRNTMPGREKFITLLGIVANQFDQAFIVIDALDEYPEDDDIRMEVLDSIKDIKKFANVLVTSRSEIPAIEKSFEGDLWEEIRAADDDIRAYLKSEIGKRTLLSDQISKRPSLREEIVTKVVSKAKGM